MKFIKAVTNTFTLGLSLLVSIPFTLLMTGIIVGAITLISPVLAISCSFLAVKKLIDYLDKKLTHRTDKSSTNDEIKTLDIIKTIIKVPLIAIGTLIVLPITAVISSLIIVALSVAVPIASTYYITQMLFNYINKLINPAPSLPESSPINTINNALNTNDNQSEQNEFLATLSREMPSIASYTDEDGYKYYDCNNDDDLKTDDNSISALSISSSSSFGSSHNNFFKPVPEIHTENNHQNSSLNTNSKL